MLHYGQIQQKHKNTSNVTGKLLFTDFHYNSPDNIKQTSELAQIIH